jgi:gas vesicle protein
MNINISDKLIFLSAGCGVGMILGALFAPRSGEETRRNLGAKVDDLTHKVQERIQTSGIKESASQTLHNVVERGRNVASIGKRRLNESVEAGRARFNESMEGEQLSER